MPELADVIAGLDALNKGIVAKTTFSMITPEQEAIEVLKATNAVSVVIFGLEVCFHSLHFQGESNTNMANTF